MDQNLCDGDKQITRAKDSFSIILQVAPQKPGTHRVMSRPAGNMKDVHDVADSTSARAALHTLAVGRALHTAHATTASAHRFQAQAAQAQRMTKH